MRHGRSHLVIDAAEVGLRGRGGHGHNDVLSFELTLDGLNVVTDCGAYVYTASPEWRNRFRSTAAHNTVQIDEAELNRLADPDDLWALRYDAKPESIVWRPGAAGDYFAASHTGYRRLADPVTHRREVALTVDPAAVLIRDHLAGRTSHAVSARLHFAPGLEARVHDDTIRLRQPSTGEEAWVTVLDRPAGLDLRIEAAWVSPSYGVRIETSAMRLAGSCQLPATMTMAISRRDPRTLDLSALRAAMEPAS